MGLGACRHTEAPTGDQYDDFIRGTRPLCPSSPALGTGLRPCRFGLGGGVGRGGSGLLGGRAGPEALEIGYWLDAGCCGRGYATEASRAMVGLVFGHFGVGRVVFRCDERNGASGAVPAKLGARVARVVTVEEGARLQVWVLEGPGELKSG